MTPDFSQSEQSMKNESETFPTHSQFPHKTEAMDSKIKCDTCDRYFSGVIYLRQHQAKSQTCKEPEGSPQWSDYKRICPFCRKTYAVSKGCRQHMKYYHKCRKCGEGQ